MATASDGAGNARRRGGVSFVGTAARNPRRGANRDVLRCGGCTPRPTVGLRPVALVASVPAGGGSTGPHDVCGGGDGVADKLDAPPRPRLLCRDEGAVGAEGNDGCDPCPVLRRDNVFQGDEPVGGTAQIERVVGAQRAWRDPELHLRVQIKPLRPRPIAGAVDPNGGAG